MLIPSDPSDERIGIPNKTCVRNRSDQRIDKGSAFEGFNILRTCRLFAIFAQSLLVDYALLVTESKKVDVRLLRACVLHPAKLLSCQRISAHRIYTTE